MVEKKQSLEDTKRLRVAMLGAEVILGTKIFGR